MLNFVFSVYLDLFEDQHDKLLRLADALDHCNEDAGFIPLDHTVANLYDSIDFLESVIVSLKRCCTFFDQDDKCSDSDNK